MYLEIILSIISILGMISSFCFAYLAYKRNDKKDTKDQAKTEAVLLNELKYIKGSIEKVEKNLDKLEERYGLLSNKLVKVEESLANAHKRINEKLNERNRFGGE